MDTLTVGAGVARPLEPFGDATVSKGFARREHAGTVDALPFVSELMQRAARPAFARFTRGRRLEPAAVSATVKDFERLLDDLADTVGRYDHDVPATRTRPRGQRHEKVRLCVSRSARDFRLVAVTMRVSTKEFYFESSPTVLGWTRHAAERCYERMGGGAKSGGAIGRALAGQFPMATLAIEAVRSRKGFCDLAIPAGGGLLLGRVHEVPEAGWEGMSVCVYDRGAAAGCMPPVATSSGRRRGTGPDADSVACWTAITYVGPDEMRPEQEAYAARWLAAMGPVDGPEGTSPAARLVAMRVSDPAGMEAYETGCAGAARWMAGFVDDPGNARILARTPWPARPDGGRPHAAPARRAGTNRLRDILGDELMARGRWCQGG